ncbi:MAG: lipase family protein [Terriglobales bacterium]
MVISPPLMFVFRIGPWRVCSAALLVCVAVAAMAQGQAQGNTLRNRSKILAGFPLTKFYDTPTPLPSGKPGELMRSGSFDNYLLPPGISATRILYYTRSASGAMVATSGVVLFPELKAPTGGWPVIAWAHDLNGVARTCAPSLSRNLDDGPFLSMYVNLGYAVVATDYTGLGTNFPNAFADEQSNAWNVIDSIPAARSAVPGLGPRWIAMGIGEGARAALSAAELEHQTRDANFLGSVAISRIADLEELLQRDVAPTADLPLLLAYGVKTIYPDFTPGDILSDQAMPLYDQERSECGVPDAGKVPTAGMWKPHWQNNKFVQDYFNRNRLGESAAGAPLLIVSGEQGASLVAEMKVVQRLCRTGDRVLFRRYAESDPGRVIGDSVRDQMAWIQDRFANRPAQTNCSVEP